MCFASIHQYKFKLYFIVCFIFSLIFLPHLLRSKQITFDIVVQTLFKRSIEATKLCLQGYQNHTGYYYMSFQMENICTYHHSSFLVSLLSDKIIKFIELNKVRVIIPTKHMKTNATGPGFSLQI